MPTIPCRRVALVCPGPPAELNAEKLPCQKFFSWFPCSFAISLYPAPSLQTELKSVVEQKNESKRSKVHVRYATEDIIKYEYNIYIESKLQI